MLLLAPLTRAILRPDMARRHILRSFALKLDDRSDLFGRTFIAGNVIGPRIIVVSRRLLVEVFISCRSSVQSGSAVSSILKS